MKNIHWLTEKRHCPRLKQARDKHNVAAQFMIQLSVTWLYNAAFFIRQAEQKQATDWPPLLFVASRLWRHATNLV